MTRLAISYGSTRIGTADLPGIEPDSDRERAERKGSLPLRARDWQRFELDGLPLFDPDARPQPELFD